MATFLTIVCFPFLVLETLIGMVANGSIVLINFIDWFRRGTLTSTDLILISLGLSRLLLQAVVIVEKDGYLNTIVCFVFLVIETLIGMVANGSIFLINFTEWFRRGRLSPTDLILNCLSWSRLLQLVLTILNVSSFFTSILSNAPFMLNGMWIFVNTVSLWFAACLSVFYLAKIAIFFHPLFLQVKRRFSGLVPWLLLGSVIFSAVVTIIVLTIWSYEGNMPHACRNIIALIAPFAFIPFTVFLLSSTLLISSLWMHMRRVQCNGAGSRDLNTQAHLSAIKALASFAVLYLISFAVDISQLVLTWNNQIHWAPLLFNVSAVYPSGHAIILILINPKLKQA
ncbi:taste receptor type 2 member 140-like [Heteronotia binoei]|uniref:taste receptor type 2 member 140-like n=1 Tax=Heteronotia binoei TaxID=13085 RepID=UPI002931B337|nr:taste receptor type 2 member 140-like [Heteronotia binoei]